MRRLRPVLLGSAVSPIVVHVAAASASRTEWWWRVIEWILENGGTWNVW